MVFRTRADSVGVGGGGSRRNCPWSPQAGPFSGGGVAAQIQIVSGLPKPGHSVGGG